MRLTGSDCPAMKLRHGWGPHQAALNSHLQAAGCLTLPANSMLLMANSCSAVLTDLLTHCSAQWSPESTCFEFALGGCGSTIP